MSNVVAFPRTVADAAVPLSDMLAKRAEMSRLISKQRRERLRHHAMLAIDDLVREFGATEAIKHINAHLGACGNE